MELNYRSAGVDREGADALVERITRMAGKTLSRNVRSRLGGYASLYELSKTSWIAASTDGVGTKLKLAFELGEHRTVGQDLVAMSVNDLVCVGAEPLFFLDYFATGKLDAKIAESVIAGIADGCALAECALVGGETAEMPGFYAAGEYDLAGFAVGKLKPSECLPRERGIRPGDRILGIASSGLHSNGFSLFRKWVDAQAFRPEERKQWLREALTPTRIYARELGGFLKKHRKDVLGMAHITGSGFLNVPRISTDVEYEVALPAWKERAPIYSKLVPAIAMQTSERLQTWNCGVGMVVVVRKAQAKKLQSALAKACGKWQVWDLGQVTRKRKGARKDETWVRIQERRSPFSHELELVDLHYT